MASNSVQIVTFEGDFTDNCRAHLERSALHSSEFNIVSIIGMQSSGKSTLLNNLFNTDFDVLDRGAGRNQTTKGIHLSVQDQMKVMVIDIEGTDSQERGDDGAAFEHMSALFALAVSGVLMVNLWTFEIGRYRGAAVGLLKTIFEVNLRLFTQQSKQRILFVLRDFNHTENLSALKGQIAQTMEKIWSEIVKPDSHKLLTVFDCFEFDFAVIGSKVHNEQIFQQDVAELRDRFVNQDRMDYLFRQQSTDIPLDGIPTYLSSIWERVRNDKDLDIPSQKKLLANLRCHELKLDAIALFKDITKNLLSNSLEYPIPNWGEDMNQFIQEALVKYDKNGSKYVEAVYLETREELYQQLLEYIKDHFAAQIRLQIQKAKLLFKTRVTDKFSQNRPVAGFQGICDEIISEVHEDFTEHAEECVIPGSGWNVSDFLIELDHDIFESIELEKERQLKLIDEDIKKQFSGKFSQVVLKTLELGEDESVWEAIAHHQKVTLDNVRRRAIELLQGLDMPEEAIIQRLEVAQQQCYEAIKAKAEKFKRVLSDSLTKKFNGWFLKDSRGVPREWERTDIETIYQDSRVKTLCILDSYRLFKVSPDPEVLPSTFEEFLTDEEYNEILQKFEENAAVSLSDAKHIQEFGYSNRSLPVWIWVILIIVGYQEAFYLVTTPIILYPMLLLISVVAVMYGTGNGAMIQDKMEMVKDYGNKISEGIEEFRRNYVGQLSFV